MIWEDTEGNTFHLFHSIFNYWTYIQDPENPSDWIKEDKEYTGGLYVRVKTPDRRVYILRPETVLMPRAEVPKG